MRKKSFSVYAFFSFLVIIFFVFNLFNLFYDKKDDFVYVKNIKQLEKVDKGAEVVLENDIDLSSWDGNPINVESIDGQGHKIYNHPSSGANFLFTNTLKMSNLVFDNIDTKITSAITLFEKELGQNISNDATISEMETWEESLIYQNIVIKNNTYSLNQAITSDFYYSPLISLVTLKTNTNFSNKNGVYFASFKNIQLINNVFTIDLVNHNSSNYLESYISQLANFIFPKKGVSSDADTHKFTLSLRNIFSANNVTNLNINKDYIISHYANLATMNTNLSIDDSASDSGLTNQEISIDGIILENNTFKTLAVSKYFYFGEILIAKVFAPRISFRMIDLKNIFILNNFTIFGSDLLLSDGNDYHLFYLFLISDKIIQDNISSFVFIGLNYDAQRNVNFSNNDENNFQDVFSIDKLSTNDSKFNQLQRTINSFYNPYLFNFVISSDDFLVAIDINESNNVLILSDSKAKGRNGLVKSLELDINLLLDFENSLLVGKTDVISMENVEIKSEAKSFFKATKTKGEESTNKLSIELDATNQDGWTLEEMDTNDLSFAFSFTSFSSRKEVSLEIKLSSEQLNNVDFTNIFVESFSYEAWFIILITVAVLAFLILIILLIIWSIKNGYFGILKDAFLTRKYNSTYESYSEYWEQDDYEGDYSYDAYETSYEDYYEYDNLEYYRGNSYDYDYEDESYDSVSADDYYDVDFEYDDSYQASTLMPEVNPNPTGRKIVLVDKIFPKPKSNIINDYKTTAQQKNTVKLENDVSLSETLETKKISISETEQTNKAPFKTEEIKKAPKRKISKSKKTQINKTTEIKVVPSNKDESVFVSGEDKEILSTYL